MLPEGYSIQELTKDYATKFADKLAQMADQIPQVEYTPEDILAETKRERILHAKWQHSFALTHNGEPVGFIMGYEREADGTEQYPKNSLHISELAISAKHQKKGLARELLKYFFKENNHLGFLELGGEFCYSIQTNSAEWNQHVVDLYKSFGFTQRATKEYDNRIDVVLGMTP